MMVAFGGGLSATRLDAGDHPGWDGHSAARYLDGRAESWFAFSSADRGKGEDKVSCLSCHTLLPYALARSVVRRTLGDGPPAGIEERVLNQVRRRVNHWDELDSPRFKLMYDFDDDKKLQSRGTEAVLSAWVLARDDRDRGLAKPSADTRLALRHVWATQLLTGPEKGSWHWVNFGMGPFESDESPYMGAAMAAIAVATATRNPPANDADAPAERIALLRGYLRDHFKDQNLHNRVWALWASVYLGDLLGAPQREALVDELVVKQRADGGWCLATLGDYKRSDGTPLSSDSDGYATGLFVHVLQQSGMTRTHPAVARGMAWLRTNQQVTGAWVGHSINKRRDPKTMAGKFMSDAATAFAILALDDITRKAVSPPAPR
jgi:squalene-hopene/tetraprenyl-beta-curcumene cyclase